ncbi:hypothetical protein QBC35DRAFT_203960 [Podospora australis]|uniref:Sialidase n=1 Tax=Podospora australis TaxID=1536484 RepID=A0AAN7ANP7_9PEZI|nr:hypothetical protein QBC35DRAFT_203960 [Podospora australis]
MSTLAADVTFDFTFPCGPSTPPSFTFDPSLLEIPYNPGHSRSSSHGSVYSFESAPSESVSAPSTRRTTPARSPIRTHGPLLLPKIRSQDQAITPSAIAAPKPKRARTSPGPTGITKSTYRPSHARSYTNPEVISYAATAAAAAFLDESNPAPLLCSPVSFTQDSSAILARRASTCSVENVSYPSYRQMPQYVPRRASTSPTPPPQQQQAQFSQPEQFLYQQYVPRAPSPLASAAPITQDMAPSTSLYSYLTSSNPAPALVRSISFPLRDPQIKHFWWDVRQVRPWTNFTAEAILSLPGAQSCLSTPISSALLPSPPATQRHPETESALHSIYASYYLPKLNNALALSSARPLQLSVPSKNANAAMAGHNSGMNTDCMFVANVAGEAATAAAIFGGKPTARVVGLVKSFDRFNTGMRVEGNVKRVEYLRGLAHLHHAMREHGCRYGFILTEIELVFVRNGGEATPHFGYMEVGSVQLAATDDVDLTNLVEPDQAQMTACLALWGLCMLAADEPMAGHAHWKSEIGAPAEGTRKKALPRDDWMPQPQLAEKREAKRSRGWVFPEDAIGRKELGKRGVRYGAC